MDSKRFRTTIGLKNNTKEKLDRNRAPGQCYDGFICQLVELWEKTHDSHIKHFSPQNPSSSLDY